MVFPAEEPFEWTDCLWRRRESIFMYPFQLTVWKRWRERKWSSLQDQGGGLQSRLLPFPSTFLWHLLQICHRHHHFPTDHQTLPPTAGTVNVSILFFFSSSPSRSPTAECYRFCIIPPHSPAPLRAASPHKVAWLFFWRNEREMEGEQWRQRDCRGNAAEENNFRSVCCPRDAPALRRHQQPQIAAVFCLSTRVAQRRLELLISLFLFIPSSCLWSVYFYHISCRTSLCRISLVCVWTKPISSVLMYFYPLFLVCFAAPPSVGALSCQPPRHLSVFL